MSQFQEKLQMTAGGKVFTIVLEANATARAFQNMIPLTLPMKELNGNEKYVELPQQLPHTPVNIGRIQAGDVMLYGSNTIVVFYEGFKTPYTYTKIGKIEDANGLAEALGKGSVTVKFERTSP